MDRADRFRRGRLAGWAAGHFLPGLERTTGGKTGQEKMICCFVFFVCLPFFAHLLSSTSSHSMNGGHDAYSLAGKERGQLRDGMGAS